MRVLNERQAKILESLETKRYISVSELSDKLKVSKRLNSLRTRRLFAPYTRGSE